jgi:hypothetical protein
MESRYWGEPVNLPIEELRKKNLLGKYLLDSHKRGTVSDFRWTDDKLTIWVDTLYHTDDGVPSYRRDTNLGPGEPYFVGSVETLEATRNHLGHITITEGEESITLF